MKEIPTTNHIIETLNVFFFQSIQENSKQYENIDLTKLCNIQISYKDGPIYKDTICFLMYSDQFDQTIELYDIEDQWKLIRYIALTTKVLKSLEQNRKLNFDDMVEINKNNLNNEFFSSNDCMFLIVGHQNRFYPFIENSGKTVLVENPMISTHKFLTDDFVINTQQGLCKIVLGNEGYYRPSIPYVSCHDVKGGIRYFDSDHFQFHKVKFEKFTKSTIGYLGQTPIAITPSNFVGLNIAYIACDRIFVRNKDNPNIIYRHYDSNVHNLLGGVIRYRLGDRLFDFGAMFDKLQISFNRSIWMPMGHISLQG